MHPLRACDALFEHISPACLCLSCFAPSRLSAKRVSYSFPSVPSSFRSLSRGKRGSAGRGTNKRTRCDRREERVNECTGAKKRWNLERKRARRKNGKRKEEGDGGYTHDKVPSREWLLTGRWLITVALEQAGIQIIGGCRIQCSLPHMDCRVHLWFESWMSEAWLMGQSALMDGFFEDPLFKTMS